MLALTPLLALAGLTLSAPITDDIAAVNTSLTYTTSTSLSSLALQKVLSDASPIFGTYTNHQTPTSNWMSRYPDATKIVHMNLPGVHDSQTWNYSLATQQALDHITEIGGIPELDPRYFRCQDKPLIFMLNAGVRVFDLRYAFDETNSTLTFWHGQALQSQTATVDDVLFGFYQWLDNHPSEALFLSFQYEGGTTLHAQNDAGVQMALYNALTSKAAKKYFLQEQNVIGTLGQARGKITLFRRFTLDQLPAEYEESIQGVHFSPGDWTDNGKDITLVYNAATNATAYIEDFYDTSADLPQGSPATSNIAAKYNATAQHILKATTQYPDSLFWTFASAENDGNSPPEFPVVMALGNGTEYTPLGGVNQQMVGFLKCLKGKRVGIVMFDFFETPGELITTFLGL